MPSNKDRLYVALYAHGGKPTMLGKEDTWVHRAEASSAGINWKTDVPSELDTAGLWSWGQKLKQRIV